MMIPMYKNYNPYTSIIKIYKKGLLAFGHQLSFFFAPFAYFIYK